ncbi:MAG TPA: FAD-binding oxidoreductase, partial [Bacteroidales bacterium]|nr:FAD-binding oxidoreductase [Bacteroidales bacterium]
MDKVIVENISLLKERFEGEILDQLSNRLQYATDASAYREVPAFVVCPMHKDDIRELVFFARRHGLHIIPRAAGTSLAGQVVGDGIVADVSRHMNAILEVNLEENWVRVEPGVILDELNLYLKPYGLFFGPETSTSNRCMIGGMLGNNACGAHSLIYGSTRDHTLAVKAILSDGSEAEFMSAGKEEFDLKCNGEGLEAEIYRNISDILRNEENRRSIRNDYPDPAIKRRNTGYALDLLLNTVPFVEGGESFNFCKLIAGSEGTLAFIYEIKLNLVPLPPPEKAVMCINCNDLRETFRANLIALKYKPGAVELMDHKVLELTKGNLTQQKNRFFVEGDPAAILIVEFARNSREEIIQTAEAMKAEMQQAGYGYHYQLIFGDDIKKVWALRKAGLG